MCTTAIYKLYYCILFFSLSKHKANTAELHPKVRQTCLIYDGNYSHYWKVLIKMHIFKLLLKMKLEHTHFHLSTVSRGFCGLVQVEMVVDIFPNLDRYLRIKTCFPGVWQIFWVYIPLGQGIIRQVNVSLLHNVISVFTKKTLQTQTYLSSFF